MYAAGRNALRQGPTGTGNRLVDLVERRLVNAFEEDGRDWDVRSVGSVEAAVFLFMRLETTPFTRASFSRFTRSPRRDR